MVPWYDEEKIWSGTIWEAAISETGSAKGIEKSSIQLQE